MKEAGTAIAVLLGLFYMLKGEIDLPLWVVGGFDRSEPASEFQASPTQPFAFGSLYGGAPSAEYVTRGAYWLAYDNAHRIPRWVAYPVTPAFLETPDREGRFSSFRDDPDMSHEPSDRDYRGFFDSHDIARGHLAPYAIAGGDRDGDGLLALSDPDDERVVFEINYMSNIGPQYHSSFNGSGGLWFELERFIQDGLVRGKGRSVFVFAGPVIGVRPMDYIGPNEDIAVPAMYFKIVVDQTAGGLLAFLFPHQKTRNGDLKDYLVSVDMIEALTGLDFFHEFAPEQENSMEAVDTILYWSAKYQ